MTAARLIGLYHLRPVKIDVTRPTALSAAGIRVHRCLLPAEDIDYLGPFRITSPTRTLIDLAGVLDADRLEDCLEEALLRRMVELPLLESRLNQIGSRGRMGAKSFRRLLALRNPQMAPTDTKFETLLHRVLRKAGLPNPERQFKIFEGTDFVTRVDFAYPRERVAIPADSYEWHSRRRQWERDIDQRNRLMRMGWKIRPTTWTELNRRPDEFTRDIATLLSISRGPRRVSYLMGA